MSLFDFNENFMVAFVDDLSKVTVSFVHYKSFGELCRSLYQVCTEENNKLPFVTYSDSYSFNLLFSFDFSGTNDIYAKPLKFSDLISFIKNSESDTIRSVSEFSQFIAVHCGLHFTDSDIGDNSND